MSDLWSVTVPQYATGIATVLLVAVTAAVFAADRRNRRAEAIRDARKVFAVAGRTEVETDLELPLAMRLRMKIPERFWRVENIEISGPYASEHLAVVNAGPDPIFNVGAGSIPIPKTAGHPGFEWSHGLHQLGVPFVLPNERSLLGGQWGSWSDNGEFQQEELPYWAYDQLQIWVTWTDARGLRWERTGSQEPKRAKVNSPRDRKFFRKTGTTPGPHTKPRRPSW